jgi:hypothetical protein
MFRSLIVLTFAVVGLLGCGGGGEDPSPPEARTGMQVQAIDFNCDFVDRMAINSSSYTVASTSTTACIEGFIGSNLPVAWSNSAGGSGQAPPQPVNCQCGSGCCQLVWDARNIPLQTGINTLVFTATASNGASDTASLTITRQP